MTDRDFSAILNDLRQARYTDTQLAYMCNCTRQYIRRLRVGEAKRPNYEIGRKLVQLHEALK